ncbi:MAG: rhodanese-like domain-containing protein [bacterium]
MDHIPGAVHIRSGDLGTRLGPLRHRPRGAPVLVYSGGGDHGASADAVTHASPPLERALRALQSWGFSNILWRRGGLVAWRAEGLAVSSGTPGARLAEIGPEEVRAWLKRESKAVVVDVRSAAEYRAGHLPKARSIPLAELLDRLAEIPRDRPVLIYCGGGGCTASEAAGRLLLKAGYDGARIRLLRGGWAEWQRRAAP